MQERLYFDDLNQYPVQIKKGDENSSAFILNLSTGGMCLAVPKKNHTEYEVGENLFLTLKARPMPKLSSYFHVIHSREDDKYFYFGGQFVGLANEDQERLKIELQNLQNRFDEKRTPYLRVLWLLIVAVMLYLAIRF
tara:strand:+ start:23497 stop:23907 length:411 start_codon:yes stop_codon:yes gene_type:complete